MLLRAKFNLLSKDWNTEISRNIKLSDNLNIIRWETMDVVSRYQEQILMMWENGSSWVISSFYN